MIFQKYQGAGNDFIIINNLDGSIHLTAERISRLCHRNFGIGADGLIMLEKSQSYDYAMKFYNSDGNTATMCGNGGRCIAKYAYDNNISGEHQTFIADDGIHQAQILSDSEVRLKMIDVHEIITYPDGMFTNTGVPHFVAFTDDITAIDIKTIGRQLADDPRFAPERTNVNFVDNRNGYRLATYERGVEDETLACGTGTVATALCINKHTSEQSPITLRAKGGILKVYFNKTPNGYTNVWLQGPAVKVFKGEE